MIETVAALLREVAAEVVLPRFRRLANEDITEKSPGDFVTVVDRDAEQMLTDRLADLLPGSIVIGEEGVHDDPSLLSQISNEGAVWVVDPLDGTANFAAGREPFAIMVALLRAGRAVAGWILDPLAGAIASAELGGGAYLGGQRLIADQAARPATELRGPALSRYMPDPVRAAIRDGAAAVGELLPGRYCAGYEYPAIGRDEQQFAVFWRMLPWDHAAGTLFLSEAGGVAWHLDGTPYEPSVRRLGVLVARNVEIWHEVRGTLLAQVS